MESYGQSVGRRYPVQINTLITNSFLNDYARLLGSKSRRRLTEKTQVFSLPRNIYVRTRAVHTDDVIATSMAIASQLGLNVPLCMAGAAGHDIGHTPFGHLGESVLTRYAQDVLGREGVEFKHYVAGVVVAQQIERSGSGLNLCYETLECMLNHSRGEGDLVVDSNLSQEAAVVMFADKIAYTFADINDAFRNGYLSEGSIPVAARQLGRSQRKRENAVIRALVSESLDRGYVSFSEGEVFEMFTEIKAFMYTNVYKTINTEIHEKILWEICKFFNEHEYFGSVDPVLLTSLLTDKEAFDFAKIMLGGRRPTIEEIRHFGIFEVLKYVKNKDIDWADPDLDWKDEAHPDVQ
ncbi:MAG: HD domain-containing protein [archaeon]